MNCILNSKLQDMEADTQAFACNFRRYVISFFLSLRGGTCTCPLHVPLLRPASWACPMHNMIWRITDISESSESNSDSRDSDIYVEVGRLAQFGTTERRLCIDLHMFYKRISTYPSVR